MESYYKKILIDTDDPATLPELYDNYITDFGHNVYQDGGWTYYMDDVLIYPEWWLKDITSEIEELREIDKNDFTLANMIVTQNEECHAMEAIIKDKDDEIAALELQIECINSDHDTEIAELKAVIKDLLQSAIDLDENGETKGSLAETMELYNKAKEALK